MREQYLIEDPGGLLLLASAMQAHTRAENARKIIEQQGETIRDRYGTPRAHPACAVERDARSSMLMAMRALRLGNGND